MSTRVGCIYKEELQTLIGIHDLTTPRLISFSFLKIGSNVSSVTEGDDATELETSSLK
jgi:hypothetical protein